jgi:antibiotic biosynthesis monooxygenase (ABM) superfamily enzyme
MKAPMATPEATVYGPAEPVTVVITRRVKAGREAEYEAWLGRLQTAARGVPGYLGVTTQRPAPGAAREYVSAVRFASLDDLRRYETSALHHDNLAEVVGLVEGDASWQPLTGLEFWFTPPPGMAVPQPSRPRMALLMIVVVFSLVLGHRQPGQHRGRAAALAAARATAAAADDHARSAADDLLADATADASSGPLDLPGGGSSGLSAADGPHGSTTPTARPASTSCRRRAATSTGGRARARATSAAS